MPTKLWTLICMFTKNTNTTKEGFHLLKVHNTLAMPNKSSTTFHSWAKISSIFLSPNIKSWHIMKSSEKLESRCFLKRSASHLIQLFLCFSLWQRLLQDAMKSVMRWWVQRQSLLNGGAVKCDRGLGNSSENGVTVMELVIWQRDSGGARAWRCDNRREGFQKSPNVNSLSPSLGLGSFIFGIILISDKNLIHQKLYIFPRTMVRQ